MRFSIITPLHRTPLTLLAETAASVREQTYPHWQWCVAIAQDEPVELRCAVEELAQQDHRIQVVYTETNQGISAQSNAALAAATGQFVVILDHDDRLAPEALYEVAFLLAEQPELDFIYSDEDHLTADSQERYDPVFKPAWSPEMFLSYNYICHLAVIRREIVNRLGGFQSEYDGAQDWDLFLRVTEQTNRIAHLPKVLYHWRAIEGSCAAGIAAKPYAVAAQRRAVTDHLRRRGLNALAETQTNEMQRLSWPLESPPRVSIIIPSKDQYHFIGRCLDTLLETTDYPHLEVIIVDNGSTDDRVLALYEQVQTEHPVRIVPYAEKFNYSRACNLGAAAASGEVLLFLNNDTEVLQADWLTELVRWTQLPGVGVVGTKLLFPDGRTQHAGIALGFLSMCGHLFYGMPPGGLTQQGCADRYRNQLMLTGACHAMSRAVYEQLGGYDEDYRLAYSDCALCIEAVRAGYRNVYTPYATLVHHECTTRGPFVPEEDELRFARLLEHYKLQQDPYFTRNIDAADPGASMRVFAKPMAEEVIRSRVEDLLHRETSSPRADAIRRILRHRPDVWRQFPHAQLPAGQKAFRVWLETHGREEHGPLDEQTLTAWEQEVATRLGENLAETYLHHPEWQRQFPLALTPFDGGSFRSWLLRGGLLDRYTEKVHIPSPHTPLQQLKLLAKQDASVSQRLERAAQTPTARRRLLEWAKDGAAVQFGLCSDWLKELEKEIASGLLQRPGVNLIGHFGYQAGLGEAVRGMRRALQAVKIPLSCRNVPHTYGADQLPILAEMGQDIYDTNLMIMQPDGMPSQLPTAGTTFRRTNRTIGMWTWELDRVPELWQHSFELVDEIWAPSQFVQQTLAQVAPVPVHRIPYCVEMHDVEPVSRQWLGIPEHHFVFLFMFDNSSVMSRKNPLAVVEAFKRAFPASAPVTLLLKVGRADHDPYSFAHLKSRSQGPNIRLLTTPLSRARCNGLIAAADCYVSLHRSEGFGLGLAEAMLLGKPVIATAYSGNLDFMSPENSMLVDYKLVPIEEDIPFYSRGNQWAEPSLENAIEWMRWIVEHPAAAQEMGEAAQQQIAQQLNAESVGLRAAELLGAKSALRETPAPPPRQLLANRELSPIPIVKRLSA